MAPTHNVHQGMNDIPQGDFLRHSSSRNNGGVRPSTNTLQSVLRGEIPSEYMLLASTRKHNNNASLNFRDNNIPMISQRPEQYFGVNSVNSQSNNVGCINRTNIYDMENKHFVPSSSNSLGSPHCHIKASASPSPSHRSLSPLERTSPFTETSIPFSTYYQESAKPSAQYYDRCSPAHECRASPFRESGSPFISNDSPYHNAGSPYPPCSPHRYTSSPYLAPYSPAAPPHSPLNPESESYPCDEQPMDLSCKSEHGGNSPAHESGLSDNLSCSPQTDGSMLRNLLSLGKQQRLLIPENTDSDRDSPCSDVYRPDVVVTSSTRVTLAKKMLYPITSRVSDWLVKIVKFTKSIPEFSSMSQNDKMTLLCNSWTRLLLLLMAENEFEFAVTPLSSEKQDSGMPPSQEEPTMKAVEGLQSFIKKCKNMSLDQKEYALLRMSVLFNAGYVGLDNQELVEKLNSAVQQLLQQHIAATRPDDVMHYSRILMCLPSLYGINCKMVENLFCTRINSNMDIELLFKNMLESL